MDIIKDKIDEFSEFYERALAVADKRVENWFLMQRYSDTLLLTALYVTFVFVGKKIMQTRDAFNLKYPLVAYNVICVGINIHIFTQLFIATRRRNYSYSCQPIDFSDNPDELKIAKAIWWFYFSKLVEMLDTVFFILRKKNSQVSFLHVYHHATMFPIWWTAVKWVAGGNSALSAMVNSLVHIIMYSYYGVSAMGPKFQRYLWWKRYLTILQLIQFVGAGILHPLQALYVACEYPRWVLWTLTIYAITLFSLFINFYIHAYKKSPAKYKNTPQSNQFDKGQYIPNGSGRHDIMAENSSIEKKKVK